ncbi:MAG: cell division protein FtsI [Lachnospiraceae bacterium]|nr:cell division protein FtsI [Lachnospiraceae bacterium]
MQKKLVVLFFVVLLAFAYLIIRIAGINRDKGEAYKKQVLSQQSYDSTTLPFKRGSIEDKNGTVLAYSEKVYNLIVDAKLMSVDEGAHIEPTLDILEKAFAELDISEVRDFVEDNPGSSYKKYVKQLESPRVENYNKMIEQAISENNIRRTDLKKEGKIEEANAIVDPAKNGVWFEEEYRRTYPYNTLACDVIGFVQAGNEGQYGLEEYYNDTLNGINGRAYGYLNTDGTLTRTVKEAQDGYTLITSLDTNIQAIAEKHIKEFADENRNAYRTGPAADNVGVIIMNPNSGEIYAMAGYPVFNLNDPQNMNGVDLVQYANLLSKEDLAEAVGISLKRQQSEEEEVSENGLSENGLSGNKAEDDKSGRDKSEDDRDSDRNDKEEDMLMSVSMDKAELLELVTNESLSDNGIIKNAVWKNFCIADTYEPGSTMKPFTVAGAMDAAAITGNETYVCNGALEVGQHVIHCHNRFGDGPLTVEQGIAKSCNVVLMDVIFAMGKKEWLRYNRNFGFGSLTGIDLAGEASGAANTFTEKMGQTDLAVASFGQGFNVTMMQMASGFSALINGGNYYAPHLVTRVVNNEGAIVKEYDPKVVKQIVSEDVSDKIRQFCNSVVMSDPEECTGWSARPAGYTMGGKTGTAEKLPRSAKNYIISFIGYAPADDPQVLCYVVIDHPNHIDQGNSTRLATTLSKDIMTEVLPYLNIFPTVPLTEKERSELTDAQASFFIGSDAVSQNAAMTTMSGNEVSSNEAGKAEGAEGTDNEEKSKGASYKPIVIQYDPGTGYPIDPNTGEVLNPDTLQPIDENVKSDLEY